MGAIEHLLGDIDKNLEPLEYNLVLCKPDETQIAILSEAFDITHDAKFPTTDELVFSIPYYINGEKNPNWDLVKGQYLILLLRGEQEDSDGKYFIINSPKEISDDREIKEIHCFSREYELNKKMIREYNLKTRQLYTPTPQRDDDGELVGVMNYISTLTSWSVDVDSFLSELEIRTRYRSFDVSEKSVLDFMVEDLQHAYGCVFLFDTVNKKIILRNVEHVNSEFLSITPNMSNDLVVAIDAYKDALQQAVDEGTLATLSGIWATKNDVYWTKKLELKALQENLKIINDQIDSAVELNQDTTSLVEQRITKENQINAKQIEYDTAKGELQTAQTNLDNFNTSIAMESFITGELLEELESIKAEQGTGLYISDMNYLQSLSTDINFDEVCTRLYCYGNNNLTFAGLTATGVPYLENFGFFKTEDYMSAGLISALDVYDALLESQEGVFQTLLGELGAIESGLFQKQGEETVLRSELASIQDEIDGRIESGEGYSDLVPTKTNKENEIAAKELEIQVAQQDLDSKWLEINNYREMVSKENNFTSAQLRELDFFVREQTWQDSAYETPEDLLEEAQRIFPKMAVPKLSFDIDVVDFLQVVDCQHDWGKIVLGDKVNISFEKFGLEIVVRLVGYTYHPLAHELELHFSNTEAMDDAFVYLSELQKNATTSSTTIDMSKYKWDLSVDNQSQIRDLIDSDLDAAKNRVLAGRDQDISVDERGIWLKKRDGVGYSDKQIRMLNNAIVLTDDNWATAKTAITPAGVMAEVLEGKTIIGSQGIFDGIDIMASGSDVMVGIGEYAPEEYGIRAINTGKNGRVSLNGDGIKVEKKDGASWVDQLYIDGATGSLKMKGDLEAAGGTFSGDLEAATGTFSGTISGGDININDQFIVDGSGNMTANAGTFGGDITIANNNAGISGAGTATSSIRFWAGGSKSTSAPFYVTQAGFLKATNVNISGAINATSGTFSGSLNGATGTFSGTLSAGTVLANGVISGGSININNQFVVNGSGSMTATNATLQTSATSLGRINVSGDALTGTYGTSGIDVIDLRIAQNVSNLRFGVLELSNVLNGTTLSGQLLATPHVLWLIDASKHVRFVATNEGVIVLRNSSGAERVFIRSSGTTFFNGGNVAIGKSTANHALDVHGSTNSTSYRVNGVLGASGTFTTADDKTVTVTGGIITNIS